MTQSNTSDRITVQNERSLQQLSWAIEVYQGKFKLIFAHCNYRLIRKRLNQRLKEIFPMEIREILLGERTQKLYQTIQRELGEKKPEAISITGLESVRDLDLLLTATDQVREEFQRNLPFPIVVWVNDRILTQLMQLAPNFESFGTTKRFSIAPNELAHWIQTISDRFFADELNYTDLEYVELESELGAAQQDLPTQDLDVKLEADLASLVGWVKYERLQFNAALESFQRGLPLWQQVDNLERQGKLLGKIAVCYALRNPRDCSPDCPDGQAAKSCFRQCFEILEQGKCWDALDRAIEEFGKILWYLQDAEQLETLAQRGLKRHRPEEAPIQLAMSYGLLAASRLIQEQWAEASQWAQQALELLSRLPSEGVAEEGAGIAYHLEDRSVRLFEPSLYWFILGRSQAQLGQLQAAIGNLELARAIGNPSYDLQLYRSILQNLQTQYFNQGDYLSAFKAKQDCRSIEQQFGLRAFIGAGRLGSTRRETPIGTHSLTPLQEGVAPEIVLSGRQSDVKRLLQRLGRNDCKLLVIHGASGVGKSSLVEAGLIPALKKTSIGAQAQDLVPLPLRVYANWVETLGQLLTKALSQRDIELTEPLDSEAAILEQLAQNEARRFWVVLICDQFEEFFFERVDPRQQQPLFEFLGRCLNLGQVKVVLSLREDYLHYLLEWSPSMVPSSIDFDILSQNIRYPLGNFSPEDARTLIEHLTNRANFPLEVGLVEELVRDLADEAGTVRPIELQVVGEQLQGEQITSLAQYRERGPKEALVQRYLAGVLESCGTQNQQVAQLVLYLLTDDQGTRPLKRRVELERELVALGADPTPLDLVLQILVGSRLVFELPDRLADRYQLVHDYLVKPIRQSSKASLIEKLATVEADRKQSQAQLLVRNHQLKWLGFGLVWLSSIALFTGVLWRNVERHKQKLEVIARIVTVDEFFFSKKQLNALMESLRIWKQWKYLKHSDSQTQLGVMATLLQSINQVKERNRLEGHQDSVWDVSYSPDGQILASTSTDRSVKLWQSDGKLLSTLKHDDSVTSVSFSPDNQILASASWDRTIKLWRLDGTAIETINAHNQKVLRVSFSPNGQFLVSGGDRCTVNLWSREGKLIRTFSDPGMVYKGATDSHCNDRPSHGGWVVDVAFSPDGQLIASASKDKTVKLWRLDGTLIATLKGHTHQVNDVSFHPNGQFLVTASHDKTLKFWNRSGRLIKTLLAHTDPILSVNFSPDGQKLTSSSDNNTIKLWRWDGESLKTLKVLETFEGHSDAVTQVSFHPDDPLFASASMDKTIKIWRFDRQFQGHPSIEHEGSVDWVGFSADGRMMASAGADRTIRLWHADGTPKGTLEGHRDRIYSVSFSPDGRLLASASRDCTVKLWQIDGTLLQTLSDPQLSDLSEALNETCHRQPSHRDYVLAVSFSPDGRTIASASRDRTVKLWNLDGTLLETLRGHTERVNSVNFSPNGRFIASGSDDGTLKLWQRDGTPLMTIDSYENNEEGHRSYVTHVVFSPNGQTLASAGWDNTVKLWNLNGELWQTFQDDDSVNRVSFSPDGEIIAVGSWDNTVKLWSVKDGTLIKALRGHDSGVLSVSFSPDGSMVVSAGDEGRVILWNLELDQLIQRSCSWVRDYLRTNANLSQSDRELCEGVELDDI